MREQSGYMDAEIYLHFAQPQINFKNMKYLFFICSILFCFACGRNEPSAEAQMAETVKNFGDFEDFYKRFHWDSTFQMSRINFPLEGLPQDADSLTIANRDFQWQRQDWKIHRGFEALKDDFTQELIPFGTDVITERLIHVSGTVGMIRRFARLDGKWYLIYYAGLNRITPKGKGDPPSGSMDS